MPETTTTPAEPERPPMPDGQERELSWREATVVISRAAPTTRADGTTEEGPTEISIALSSEAAVERVDWWTGERYQEVLGHGAGEVNLDYARDGVPFLISHDQREQRHLQAGIVEGVRVDADGLTRGKVRFSRGDTAQLIRQDMLDGIRKKVSVGYDPGEQFTETKANGVKTRRYTGWRLLEVSSVPIPADYDVGVGRSARPGARRLDGPPGTQASKAKENHVPEAPAAPAPEAGTARAGVSGDKKEIAALARQHKMEDKLADWIGNDLSLDAVRSEIMTGYQKKFADTVTRGGGGDVLDLSPKEQKQFSFARAIKNNLDGERGYEHEVSDALYKKLGKQRSSPNAFMVPTQLLGRQVHAGGQRMEVATSGAGQQLKFTEYGGFLDLLRARMYTGRLGVTTLSGLQGDLAFVTQTSANTFQWGAETANPTATNFGTGLKTLAPKAGSAKTNYTRQLLAQSVESIEGLVQADLMAIVAIGLDKAIIQGSGTNSQPTGITATTGIGSVAMGTAGGVPTFPKLVDLWTEIANDDADAAAMAFLTTPGISGYLQKTQQFSGTNGVPIWTWGSTPGEGQVNGHRAFATNQVPSTLTKGSSTGVCHAVIFGDWPSIVVGEWGAMELLVDPYSNGPAIIDVSAYLLTDVLLRYPQKFAAILDALTS